VVSVRRPQNVGRANVDSGGSVALGTDVAEDAERVEVATYAGGDSDPENARRALLSVKEVAFLWGCSGCSASVR